MFVLFLNDMRYSKQQNDTIARAETKEKLIEYAESLKVEPYTDIDKCLFTGGDKEYKKVYKPGSALEWYNIYTGENPFFKEIIDFKTIEEIIKQETEKLIKWWECKVLKIPTVPGE